MFDLVKKKKKKKKRANIIKTRIKKVGAELVRSRLSVSGNERHAKI